MMPLFWITLPFLMNDHKTKTLVHQLARLARKAIPAALTLLIITLLLQQISIKNWLDVQQNLSYVWLAIGVVLYVIVNAWRAARMKFLLSNHSVHFYRLLLIIIVQSMFNNMLPARSGEFSMIYLLYKYEAVPMTTGTAILIITRLFDYLAVTIIFIVAALISLNTLSGDVVPIFLFILVFMALIVMILFLLVWFRERSLALIQSGLTYIGLTRYPIVQFGLKKTGQIIQAFGSVHSFKQFFGTFLLSLVIWFSTFAWFDAFLRAIAVDTEIIKLIVGSTFAILSKAVPFISVGGFGTHEAGWTLGFMLVGFDKTLAISSGFIVNIFTLFASVGLGILSLWILHLERKQLLQKPQQP